MGLKFISISLLAVLTCGAGFCVLGADDGTQPEAGETQLSADDAAKTLEALAERFKSNPRVKAHVTVEVEDMLGPRKEEGEMLLDRSGRLLEKFTKPGLKVKLFDAMKLHEYAGKRKIDYVKDFSKAPNLLKLIQAIITADIKELNSFFNITVFSRTENGTGFRLVLTHKSVDKNTLKYKFIEGRISEKGLFFDMIQYAPDAGDKIVERYTDIQAVEAFKDDDFKLNLPEDATSKVEVVSTDDK
jgi:outer membrane lipoprotein-sorting protein